MDSYTDNGQLHRQWTVTQTMDSYTDNGQLHRQWTATQTMDSYIDNGQVHRQWTATQTDDYRPQRGRSRCEEATERYEAGVERDILKQMWRATGMTSSSSGTPISSPSFTLTCAQQSSSGLGGRPKFKCEGASIRPTVSMRDRP